MKEKDHPRYLVQLNEVCTLAPQLLRSDEIASARRQSAVSAGNIEAIEARQTKLFMQKIVRLLLEPAI
jgi:hypothetical protein